MLQSPEHPAPFPLQARGWIFLVWLYVSIGFYSMLCMFTVLFSKKLAYALGKLWCQQFLIVAGARLQIRGLENIQPGQRYTVISNHQSQLDILTLMSVLPLNLYFIAKKELFNIPFFGWGIRALGHIPIDRSKTRHVLETFSLVAQRVQSEEQMSLVLFPEGTRSEDGSMGEFKQGSFTLVLAAGLPILPVAIQGTKDVLSKSSVIPRPGAVTLTVGKPIDISSFHKTDKPALAKLVQNRIFQLTRENGPSPRP